MGQSIKMKGLILLAFAWLLVDQASGFCSSWGGWSSCSNRIQSRTRICSNLSNGETECTRQVRGCNVVNPPMCGSCPSGCRMLGGDRQMMQNCICSCRGEIPWRISHQCMIYRCSKGNWVCDEWCRGGLDQFEQALKK